MQAGMYPQVGLSCSVQGASSGFCRRPSPLTLNSQLRVEGGSGGWPWALWHAAWPQAASFLGVHAHAASLLGFGSL